MSDEQTREEETQQIPGRRETGRGAGGRPRRGERTAPPPPDIKDEELEAQDTPENTQPQTNNDQPEASNPVLDLILLDQINLMNGNTSFEDAIHGLHERGEAYHNTSLGFQMINTVVTHLLEAGAESTPEQLASAYTTGLAEAVSAVPESSRVEGITAPREQFAAIIEQETVNDWEVNQEQALTALPVDPSRLRWNAAQDVINDIEGKLSARSDSLGGYGPSVDTIQHVSHVASALDLGEMSGEFRRLYMDQLIGGQGILGRSRASRGGITQDEAEDAFEAAVDAFNDKHGDEFTISPDAIGPVVDETSTPPAGAPSP